jgi:hypothetical protein
MTDWLNHKAMTRNALRLTTRSAKDRLSEMYYLQEILLNNDLVIKAV